MEIRRIDKELIQPAASSETGNKVDVDRRHRDRNNQQEEKRDNENEEELTSEELSKLRTYTLDGHLEKQDTVPIKHINFKA